MIPFIDILWFILQGLAAVYFEPMFWGILLLVGFQYWQMQKNQLRMFGATGSTVKQQVVWAIVYGGVGGVIGSIFATIVGIALNRLGISYIWPVALGLMLINMRFICFAYAGGLVALSKLLFGWPEVDVPQVLALVGVLHITESVLIYISGRYSAMPLIVRKDDGRLVGGFSLQNFWPLPLVLMAAVGIPGNEMAGINMPDWWPLLPIGIEPPEGQQWLYVMLPVVAALGYTDIALTTLPSERRKLSAFHLAIYSIILLTLAVLSAHYPWLQFIAALVSPLGHELLIYIDGQRERAGIPMFVPPEYGVMVLDTISDGPARKIGLKPGDIILAFDGRNINAPHELAWAIDSSFSRFALDVFRQGKNLRLTGSFEEEHKQLGVILVPSGYEQYYMSLSSGRFGLWDWLKNKFKKH